MKLSRSSGVLAHITSLPGAFGSGTLGAEARHFVDWLAGGGQSYWQVLPVNPVFDHLGFSPYASSSAFAGNELLISPETLHRQGLLPAEVLAGFPANDESNDFALIQNHRWSLLRQAFQTFQKADHRAENEAWQSFCRDNRFWLDDYCLYTLLSQHHRTHLWLEWETNLARRHPDALAEWRRKLAADIELLKFVQFQFFSQWRELKSYANARGVRIIGDIPIYVSLESADCWSHPEIFRLDPRTGKPDAVSGVPPDYFSSTGQRWGNPLYRWFERPGQTNGPTLDWWQQRLRHQLMLFDLTRIDHFRGFESYWAIPADAPTAVTGSWQKGPGQEFFREMKRRLGSLPLIAEDLGIITDEVRELCDQLELPGMKILQFAFDGDPRNPYLPHNFSNPNCVVYTGTHDNNTTCGWFYGDEIDDRIRKNVHDYLGCDQEQEIHWQLIRLALASTAALVITPLQDLCGLDYLCRMNTPGKCQGNWRWRLSASRSLDDVQRRLLQLTRLFNR